MKNDDKAARPSAELAKLQAEQPYAEFDCEGLEDELADLEEELETATPSERPRLVAAVKEVRIQMLHNGC